MNVTLLVASEINVIKQKQDRGFVFRYMSTIKLL